MLIPVREVPVRERVLAPFAHRGGGGGLPCVSVIPVRALPYAISVRAPVHGACAVREWARPRARKGEVHVWGPT